MGQLMQGMNEALAGLSAPPAPKPKKERKPREKKPPAPEPTYHEESTARGSGYDLREVMKADKVAKCVCRFCRRTAEAANFARPNACCERGECRNLLRSATRGDAEGPSLHCDITATYPCGAWGDISCAQMGEAIQTWTLTVVEYGVTCDL